MGKERVVIIIHGIYISDEKAEYIQRRHGVSRDDVWAVFINEPRYFVDERQRFAMIGPTASGRFLVVGIMPEGEDGLWRLITAYWLGTRRARLIYGED